MLSTLLAALALLNPQPDLSNHWRWASASVNQSSSTPSPIPSPVVPVPSPTPNPVPIPSPTIKPGDDCPGCTGGWIDSDGSAKVKCWKCNGDGIANIGDPILTNQSLEDWQNSQPSTPEKDNGKDSNVQPIESDKEVPTPTPQANTTPKTNELGRKDGVLSNSPLLPPSNNASTDPDSKAICYKPIYSDDGYWLWDLEGKKWIRSSKQPPKYTQVTSGHWETKTYKSCNGRNCKTYTKRIWIPGKKIAQPSTPKQANYPVRGSWWTGCRNWTHLTKGQHAGKFDSAYLQKLSWEELQSLHSDNHEGRTKWQYVNK